MVKEGACMVKGVCVVKGVHGEGACMVKGLCMMKRGSCMTGGHAWWWGACTAGETAAAADGTHPTGMHSCFKILFTKTTTFCQAKEPIR